jgi:nitrate reductase NapA
MDRREFVQATALAAATAAASRRALAQVPTAAPSPPAVDPSVVARNGAGVVWNKAPCRFCGTGCTVQVGVRAGRVVAIAGDQQAPVNRGLLCVKGYHVGLALYGSDRLTRPLLKRNGRHEPISWEEAIDTMARRVMAGPARFAMYGSGQWTIPEGYAAQKFMKGGLGNNHIDPNARLCMASAVTGFLSTYGVDEPASCFDDLDHAGETILRHIVPHAQHQGLINHGLQVRQRMDFAPGRTILQLHQIKPLHHGRALRRKAAFPVQREGSAIEHQFVLPPRQIGVDQRNASFRHPLSCHLVALFLLVHVE